MCRLFRNDPVVVGEKNDANVDVFADSDSQALFVTMISERGCSIIQSGVEKRWAAGSHEEDTGRVWDSRSNLKVERDAKMSRIHAPTAHWGTCFPIRALQTRM